MYHRHAGISLLIVTRALAQVVVMINEEVESGKDPKVRDDIDRFGITNRYLGSGFKSLSSPLCSSPCRRLWACSKPGCAWTTRRSSSCLSSSWSRSVRNPCTHSHGAGSLLAFHARSHGMDLGLRALACS